MNEESGIFAINFIMGRQFKKLLKGKTAEIFATSQGPTWWYKIFSGPVSIPDSYGVSVLKNAVLNHCGIKTKRVTTFGNMGRDSNTLEQRNKFLKKVEKIAKNIQKNIYLKKYEKNTEKYQTFTFFCDILTKLTSKTSSYYRSAHFFMCLHFIGAHEVECVQKIKEIGGKICLSKN